MATQYPFTVPGHENHTFAFQSDGFSSKIFMDGHSLKQKGGKFYGALMSGEEIVLGLKYHFDILNPKITYKGQVITAAPPFSKSEMFLVYLPVVLVFTGGAIGGLFGGLAAYINNSVIRGKSSGAVKVVLSLVVTLSAFMLYAVSAGLIHTSMNKS